MRIVVDINHPGHVHYFKHFIADMRRRGHDVLITASEKEISYQLLDEYGLDYVRIGSYGSSLADKAMNIPRLDMKMFGAVRKFRPDLFVGFASTRNAHVSRMMRRPAIAFDDSELSPVEHMLYVPFTDAVLTPSCFRKDFGKKHIRYDGYIELAYLHPRYFRPDPAALDAAGIDVGDPYVVMRFVGWKAGHDVGRGGFDLETKIEAVKALEKHGRVLISSELPLPPELEPYRLKAPPGEIHNLLYYARMLVGESGTMTTEAAILGTPAISCNSIVASGGMGNFVELERKYGLIYSFGQPRPALDKALELLGRPGLKQEWKARRDKMLGEKIDVNAFMVQFAEDYPGSFFACREQGVVRCSAASSS